MKTGVSGKRADRTSGRIAAGRYAAEKSAWGRSLKIKIRCGLLRSGFHWPILIFLKAKGLKTLNPTTRVYGNTLFKPYIQKQVFAYYMVLNRFYKQIPQFAKPRKSKFAAGRAFSTLFPPMSTGRQVYIDRIQYLNRISGRQASKDQGHKGRMFFVEWKNFKNTIFAKQNMIMAEKKSANSADPGQSVRRADAGRAEPMPGFPNSETSPTAQEVFVKRNRSGSSAFGIPAARTVPAGQEPLSAPRAAYVSEKFESPKSFLAKGRIFRIVAECSITKNIQESGQTGFWPQLSMFFPESAGLSETGRGRIEDLFSKGPAFPAGNKVASVSMAPQAGGRQTVGTVLKQERSVFSRIGSGRSMDVSTSRRFDTFRNALRSSGGIRPEFSQTGFGQGPEGIPFPGQPGVSELRTARIIKEAEALDAEALLAGTGVTYLEIESNGSRSGLGEKQIDVSINEKHAARGTRYPFPLPENNAGDRVASGTPAWVLKTAEQNKQFMMQIMAPSRRILNRMERTNIMNSGLQKETGRQKDGMRRMRVAGIGSHSVFQEQAKAEPRFGISNAKSFSGRRPGKAGPAKESRPGRSLPGLAEVVYQKQGNGRALSAANSPAPGTQRPEFVLKKERTQSRQTPANQQQNHFEAARSAVQTVYEHDDKKQKTREINVIADRVYQILEKRIAVERDRRGLA